MQTENSAQMMKSEGLTYEEAMEALKNGHSVKLPEWRGIWFMVNGVIYVFTKDDQLLDTPDHEQYGKRDDWTLDLSTVRDLPVRFIKTLRIHLDVILGNINGVVSRSRESALAATHVQSGFMWLGLYLAQLGADNPYPQSMNPESPIIEKHADKANTNSLGDKIIKLDETGVVKLLRLELQKVVSFIEFITPWVPTSKFPQYVAIDKLIEARLWLGQQLNNIRLASEQK